MLTSPDTTFPVFIDPVWTTAAAYSWGMVSSGYPDESYYKFDGKSTEGVGRCLVSLDPNCVKNQTKRLFYRMKLPSLKGAYIESAEFVAYETHAHDCDNPTVVQLWRASALSSGATWNNTSGNWGTHLASRDVAYCSRAPVEFGGSTLRSHVQSAIDKGYGTITFGLRAYDESSMGWWKRFADDAYLRVQYNRPPNQSSEATMRANPGGECRPSGQRQTVNDIPTVYAYLSDPDTEDANKVRGQFTLHWANNADGSDWGEKWTSALTPALTSGTQHQIKLPSNIPQKTRMAWGVRAYDGTQYGPWSYAGAQLGCYFEYDPAIPTKPTITSADYPADGVWRGGVGESGRFVISDSAGVAAQYKITLNSRPVKTVATTNGAQQVVVLAPDRSGPNTLEVQAFAPSAQNGATVSYEFQVKAGADPVARFALDEDAGSSAGISSGPGRPASLRGPASLGAEGRNGSALSLDGVSGFAESSLPVVDTTESFSVSAWVRPTQTRIGTVVSQEGTHQSGPILGMEPGGHAVLKSASTDTNDGGGPWQFAVDDAPLPLGQWSHLTGVYDKAAAQMRLYVNGALQATVNNATTLDTHGAVQIGRAFYNSGFRNHWPGSIDDVQVFSEPLSAAQAGQLAAGTTIETGQVAHWNMDEPAGDVRVYSPAAPWQAAVHGGATLGAPGKVGTALSLDNTTQQYAATQRPAVNTQRSFAVSAWLKPDGSATSPTQNFTAVSVRGQYMSGFYLKYVEANDTWVFARTAHDIHSSGDEGWYQATWQGVQTDEWAHVVGVYDAVEQRLKIYVNGEKGTDSPPVTSQWPATGGLEIGRAQWDGNPVDHWAGEIDDVRVYDRILGAGEVEELVTQHPTLVGRWKFNTDGAGEPGGAPTMALAGGALIDPELGFKFISAAGLSLNGTSAYAETAAPPVRTDDSFTIAGWVHNMARPTTTKTVFSQAGANTNAFVLRYVPDAAEPADVGAWRLEMKNADNADDEQAPPRMTTHPSFNEQDWDHLAIVYDALRDRMSLYVNGALHQSQGGVSQENAVLGFAADNAGLQVGRTKFGTPANTEFWPGAIDDVWVYQGALSSNQIGRLAVADELPTEDGP
jgi:hypothetical protein